MAIPLATNNTCDIYRAGNTPPAAPDVAAVSIYLKPDYRGGMEATEGNQILTWTHLALVGPTVDIRDDWAHTGPGGNEDHVYVPDKNGTRFKVLFIERVFKNLATDHKRVYLKRIVPTWPSNEL